MIAAAASTLAETPASPAPQGQAVFARGLSKRYGDLLAVDSLDLDIAEGEFFGLLGPNGSGKTTTIHMLSTLARPSAGEAWVAGGNVRGDAVRIRAQIGLVFQESALDRHLSCWENLMFAGALHGLPPALAARRAEELLRLFELYERRDTMVGTLSGGMRRALDIARGVLHQPRVLFLDEPTIGLDIINRRSIWRFLARLRRRQGTTVLLTTHYLEEARDCDQVAFLRKGRLMDRGRPAELTAALGAHILELEPEGAEAEVLALLEGSFTPPARDGEHLLFRIPAGFGGLAELQKRLQGRVASLQLRRPDLNDVYIWKNQKPAPGEMLEEAPEETPKETPEEKPGAAS